MDKNEVYKLLRDFSLEEILEQNNIEDEEVLEALFEQGYSFEESPKSTD